MSSAPDVLEVKRISVTDDYLTSLAEKYLNLRSSFAIVDENHAIFKNTDFSTDTIKKIIRENSKPARTPKEKRLPVNDIYRSDIGELLLTDYFEYEIQYGFRLPLKNIWDREHNDLPGRGFDAIGYKMKGNKIDLLLGEAKVTSAKSVPPVVDKNEDSMYETHLRHKMDKKYLERKITNFAKKLVGDDAAVMQYILFSMANGDNSFEVTFGCCMLRDDSCLQDPKDFGKFIDGCDPFRPGKVHFVIYSFDKKLDDVVNIFHEKVEAA
jgi:hypothetical protein